MPLNAQSFETTGLIQTESVKNAYNFCAGIYEAACLKNPAQTKEINASFNLYLERAKIVIGDITAHSNRISGDMQAALLANNMLLDLPDDFETAVGSEVATMQKLYADIDYLGGRANCIGKLYKYEEYGGTVPNISGEARRQVEMVFLCEQLRELKSVLDWKEGERSPVQNNMRDIIEDASISDANNLLTIFQEANALESCPDEGLAKLRNEVAAACRQLVARPGI